MYGFVLVPDCTIHFYCLKYRASEASEEKICSAI